MHKYSAYGSYEYACDYSYDTVRRLHLIVTLAILEIMSTILAISYDLYVWSCYAWIVPSIFAITK